MPTNTTGSEDSLISDFEVMLETIAIEASGIMTQYNIAERFLAIKKIIDKLDDLIEEGRREISEKDDEIENLKREIDDLKIQHSPKGYPY
jgi:ATP-dependent Clp protease ATP-binding subunit ClpA